MECVSVGCVAVEWAPVECVPVGCVPVECVSVSLVVYRYEVHHDHVVAAGLQPVHPHLKCWEHASGKQHIAPSISIIVIIIIIIIKK